MRTSQVPLIVATVVGLLACGLPAGAQCPEEPPLLHYTDGGTVACPCFVAGEEAGAVFDAPAEHYTIEILRVGIGWGSVYGGNPQQIEAAIHFYGAGLPNPGPRIYSLEGPQLTDGVINEFDLEPLPDDIFIDDGSFAVTLEFFNDNAGNIFASTMVHDGNGCQPGKNVVYAIPGGWYDACALGVTGDWVVYVVYRQVDCDTAVGEEQIMYAGTPALFELHPCYPNPFNPLTTISFDLRIDRPVQLAVYALDGSLVRTLVDGQLGAGSHEVIWNGRDDSGRTAPSGTYVYRLKVDHHTEMRHMTLLK